MIVLLLIGLIVLLVSRRRKARQLLEESNDVETGSLGSGADILIRGMGISLKIPEAMADQDAGVLVGRSTNDCDYVIEHPSISRLHLKLTRRDGILYIEDLGSANGTALNGMRLTVGQPVALHDSDDLEMADALFSVSIVSSD